MFRLADRSINFQTATPPMVLMMIYSRLLYTEYEQLLPLTEN